MRTTVTRNCEECGDEFQATPSNIEKGYGRFCSHSCAGTNKARTRGWNMNGTPWKPLDPEKRRQSMRKWALRTKYNMDEQQKEAMFIEQQGKCAICLREFVNIDKAQIDHDHKTGVVRELLCSKCNLGLISLESGSWFHLAKKYLRKHNPPLIDEALTLEG